LDISCTSATSAIERCFFRGYRGITTRENVFNLDIRNCEFQVGSGSVWPSGSWAVGVFSNHVHLTNVDIAGYEHGIRISGGGTTVFGARIETNKVGIMVGQDINGGPAYSGGDFAALSFEANERAFYLYQSAGTFIRACGINGTTNGVVGIDIGGEPYNTTVFDVIESGTHTTAFVKSFGFHHSLTFIEVRSSTPWALADNENVWILHCEGVTDIVRSPVVATANLPAASSKEDGRTIIENAGAGDRNLIIYGGGQRFRIDGGAAF